ncbi:hypothetical protein PIB30_041340, partial [Stylosanthes scabra]|nr:hypothetical protein [Stylosanthes scabra]
MVSYFHETHFGKNSQDAATQPPWIQYWTGGMLWKRMKQEKTMAAVRDGNGDYQYPYSPHIHATAPNTRPIQGGAGQDGAGQVKLLSLAAGLIKIAKMHVEKEGKSKKNAKKRSSFSSESEYVESSYESESGSDDTFSPHESDSEQTISESLVQVERKSKRTNDSVSEIQDGHTLAQAVSSIRKRKNLQREKSRNKRTKQPVEEPPIDPATVSLGNDESNAESVNLFIDVHEQHHQQPHQQPPKEEEPPHEQPPPQQPHQPCQQQQPQQEFIDISSSSEGEPEPTPIRVLIPKAEPDIVSSPRDRLEEEVPSQSVVKVVPIYPTQEVIDISSSSEDEPEPQPQHIKVVVPKIEYCLVTSPSLKL